jgi:sporulation protein YlmC with PRC-barrel domain
MQSKRWLYAAIVPLFGATLASAQDKHDKTEPTAQSTPQISKDALKDQVPFCHKASEINGTKIRNAQGEDLGKVDDLLIDPESGAIEYAVVSFGGFLGMGNKLFAVPFDRLEAPQVPEGSKLAHFTFNVDKSKLENAPNFDKDEWPDITTPTWRQEIDRFYDSTAMRPVEASGEHGRVINPTMGSGVSGELMRASKLIGKNVDNPQEDNLGEIGELVLDPGRCRVNYFVLESGGFLGLGEKLFAIPWDAIEVQQREGDDQLVLNVPKERFKDAPEYEDSDWDLMSNPVWMGKVYTHYECRPYWDDAQGSSNTQNR